jgi:IS5 family transposase
VAIHAPETVCIGKGKASAPYGVQFVLHAKALPGNPYDGHTLRDDVIDHAQKLTGCAPMSTRGTVDTMRKIHAASSSRDRSAASSAPSSASCDANPRSSP